MAKTRVKRVLLAGGILRLAARMMGKGAAILMYHSVLDDPARVENSLGKMIHGRAIFQAQMELLASEYNPVTLTSVARFVRGEQDLPERPVVITFDDGYTDNYEIAMPIMDRVGIPGTFYATVDCIENRRLPWPSRLRFAYFTTVKSHWTGDNGRVWPLNTPSERESCYLAACDQTAQLAGSEQEDLVARIESELAQALPSECGEWMMSWEQLRKLMDGGHIVGSHTMTHPNLAFLGATDVRWELIESKRQMESRLGREIVHFSYPCPALSPNWSGQTEQESRKAGYQTAVTTSSGLVRRTDNPLALKRVLPSKTVDGLRWNLETAFAGRAV